MSAPPPPDPNPFSTLCSPSCPGTATNAVVHAAGQATKTMMYSEGLGFRRLGSLFAWGGGRSGGDSGDVDGGGIGDEGRAGVQVRVGEERSR